MARINIEDSIFKDTRFFDLSLKLGSKRTALGALVEAFILAQQYFLKSSDHLIPLEKWKEQKISDELIEVGLAEMVDDGIYVKGSKEQFGWLKQKSEAGKKNRTGVNVRLTGVNVRLTGDVGRRPLSLSLAECNDAIHDFDDLCLVGSPFKIKNNNLCVGQHEGLIIAEQQDAYALSALAKPKSLRSRKRERYTYSDSFLNLWDLYPRKKKKEVSSSAFDKIVKEGKSFEDIEMAMKNYINHVKNDHREIKYILHFNNFLKEFEDWIFVNDEENPFREKTEMEKYKEERDERRKNEQSK